MIYFCHPVDPGKQTVKINCFRVSAVKECEHGSRCNLALVLGVKKKPAIEPASGWLFSQDLCVFSVIFSRWLFNRLLFTD